MIDMKNEIQYEKLRYSSTEAVEDSNLINSEEVNKELKINQNSTFPTSRKEENTIGISFSECTKKLSLITFPAMIFYFSYFLGEAINMAYISKTY